MITGKYDSKVNCFLREIFKYIQRQLTLRTHLSISEPFKIIWCDYAILFSIYFKMVEQRVFV